MGIRIIPNPVSSATQSLRLMRTKPQPDSRRCNLSTRQAEVAAQNSDTQKYDSLVAATGRVREPAGTRRAKPTASSRGTSSTAWEEFSRSTRRPGASVLGAIFLACSRCESCQGLLTKVLDRENGAMGRRKNNLVADRRVVEPRCAPRPRGWRHSKVAQSEASIGHPDTSGKARNRRRSHNQPAGTSPTADRPHGRQRSPRGVKTEDR
jgi:hypothetical protein